MLHNRALDSPTNHTASRPTAIEDVVESGTGPTNALPSSRPVRGSSFLTPVGASEPDGVALDRDRRRGLRGRRRAAGAPARVRIDSGQLPPRPLQCPDGAGTYGELDGRADEGESADDSGVERDPSPEIAELRPDLEHAENAAFVERDPDRPFADGQPDRDPVGRNATLRRDDGVRLRIDPGERAPFRIDHPDGAFAGGDQRRAEPERDVGDDLAGDGIDDAYRSRFYLRGAPRARTKDGEARTERDRSEARDARCDDRPPRKATRRRRLFGFGLGLCRDRSSDRQRLVLAQDRRLEIAQFLAGLQPEIVLEGAATRLVDVECARLSAGAVEGEHQLRTEPLPVGMLRDQRLELRHECGIAAKCEIGIDSLLERAQSQLVELCDGGARERLGPQLRQRLIPPELEGFVQQGGPTLRVGRLMRLSA